MELTDHTIVPRNVSFGISKNAERHWFGGDLNCTAMMDCMSIFLPEGERFFISSLKHYRQYIDDEEVLAAVKGYSVQEAFHTREHEDYNNSLRAFGYDVDGMEAPAKDWLRRPLMPVKKLAATCAMEHLTMTYSLVTIRVPQLLEQAPAPYKRMWMWHAVEELEHCTVALDVYRKVTKDWPAWKRYGLRVGAFSVVFFRIWQQHAKNMARYARKDGVKTDWKYWLRVGHMTFIQPGFIRRGAGNLFRYFLPGYHPNPKHYGKELEIGRKWIGRELPELAEDSIPA